MIALRLHVVDGYITEIETVIARPEKPAHGKELCEATFTLFVPPLEADLDPESFQTPAPALTRAVPRERSAIKATIDSYQNACAGRDLTRAHLLNEATRRDNGHVAGDLVTSPMATLTSVRGRRPWLIDADRGIAHVEELVRRLPYGRGSDWEAL